MKGRVAYQHFIRKYFGFIVISKRRLSVFPISAQLFHHYFVQSKILIHT